MISRLLYIFERALRYVKDHPQLFFVLVLLFVVPFLFLYSGQQFLNIARSNQDRLEKDRIGLLQDSFVSLLYASHFSTSTAQTEMTRIAKLNPDITGFSLTHLENKNIVTLASLATSTIGKRETYTDYYRSATVRTDESLIFETYTDQGRQWLVYRAVEVTPGDFYFVSNHVSLAAVDSLFKQREYQALWSLIYIYLLIIGLAYWHIRLTDYHYLYVKAEKESHMKDLFTNMIAHELKAPLTAIRGYASMMSEHASVAEQMTYAQRIEESSERLLGIIKDLLDVARIQSGKLSVERVNTDVSKVVEAVIRELLPTAKEKGIRLLATGVGDAQPCVTDPQRLQQAITNLVSNAIKYTDHGDITVSVDRKIGELELRVKDTGMGISANDQRKLFAPFFRVDSTDVRNISGTGLGMWITRQLIELMGGSVNVESIEGVGTHVIVTLPLEGVSDAP